MWPKVTVRSYYRAGGQGSPNRVETCETRRCQPCQHPRWRRMCKGPANRLCKFKVLKEASVAGSGETEGQAGELR